MYIKTTENILLLIYEDSIDFQYWNKIINEQNNGLLIITFGSKIYHQINSAVINNVSREVFINGEYYIDLMDYMLLVLVEQLFLRVF